MSKVVCAFSLQNEKPAVLSYHDRPSIMKCALAILHNECPFETSAYLCLQGEEDEDSCVRCWENYLFTIANPKKVQTYQFDLDQQKTLESRVVCSD